LFTDFLYIRRHGDPETYAGSPKSVSWAQMESQYARNFPAIGISVDGFIEPASEVKPLVAEIRLQKLLLSGRCGRRDVFRLASPLRIP
jgi:hypothetical protein